MARRNNLNRGSLAFVAAEDALHQIAKLTAREWLGDKRGKTIVVEALAHGEIDYRTDRNYRDSTQQRVRLDMKVDREGGTVREVDVKQDKIRPRIHGTDLLNDVCAGRVTFEVNA